MRWPTHAARGLDRRAGRDTGRRRRAGLVPAAQAAFRPAGRQGAASAAPPADTEAGGTAAPAVRSNPVTLAAGGFRSLGHATTGRAVVLDLGGGTRLLRLEGLRTSNGPDLFVYLSATLAQSPRQAFGLGFVSLGHLKANQGNQNYQIPAGVDVRRHRNVVVWCRRFAYAFGAAPLR